MNMFLAAADPLSTSVSLASLWLPIVVGAVACFFASSLIWMALPIHKGDYKSLGAAESRLGEVIRSLGSGPGVAGQYVFPHINHATFSKDQDAQARHKAGPWGFIVVNAGPANMGKSLGMWIVNLLLVGLLIGYVASHALGRGASFGEVMQVTMTVAILAHGGNILTDSIWKGRPWSLLPGAIFDAVVYAALTSAAFALLWPK